MFMRMGLTDGQPENILATARKYKIGKLLSGNYSGEETEHTKVVSGSYAPLNTKIMCFGALKSVVCHDDMIKSRGNNTAAAQHKPVLLMCNCAESCKTQN